ncbi:MAG: pseudaminic acid synthase [Bacteroidia bacterium]|nr:pseudaminic acid synthase [Bacteroidia bacterium]
MKIKDFELNQNSGTFIIAELSANHNQDFDLAVKTIEEVAKTGADAVKIQTYTADTITIDCNNKYFQINQGTIWDGKTLYELYKEAFTPWDWQPKLKEIAEKLGLIFFSSPFDFTAVDFLEKINVPAYKIASFEITDIPLIEYVAKKGKPVILSIGIATIEDIQLAVDTCRKVGNNQIALLKCTSSYPAPIEEANLATIQDLTKRFNVIAGLSDHTISNSTSIAAVALGAKIIEKHFIIDRSIGGPDASFSIEPNELKHLVQNVREVEKAIGTVSYELSPKVLKSKEHSRSLFVVKNINAGDVFTNENVRSIRPGFGLHTKFLVEIIGKTAKTFIPIGTPLSWELVE